LITTEFYIDGEWVSEYGGEDLSARVRQADQVRITRGLQDQQSGMSAQQSIFTLNNRDGLFSGRNPNSPLYGKLGRNTPVRQGVKAADGTWEPYLFLPQLTGFGAFTTDKASLDITGDIDLRIDITPDTWRGTNWTLMGKYATSGDNRSWILRLYGDGTMRLSISTAGTFATVFTYISTALPAGNGRMALRVTLDVNNGSGNHTVRWYTAPHIDGTWTEFSSYTGVGITSIFASTANLEIGSANGGGVGFTDGTTLAGKVHAAQVYNGIAGTLVADFRPDQRADLSDTIWTDTCAAPNDWVFGSARSPRLASDRIRFCGELAALPHKWDVTGRDVFVPVQAFGILRRLSTNSSPAGSAIYRNYRNYPNIIGYWPMEDSAGSTQAANMVTGPAGMIQSCDFAGAANGLDGSAGALTLVGSPGISRVKLQTRPISGTVTVANLIWYFRLSSLPAANATFLTVQGTGIVRKWEVKIGPTSFEFIGYGVDGSTLVSRSTTFGSGANPTTAWIGMQLKMTQTGSNLLFENSWHAVGSETFYTTDVGGYLLLTPTGTIGRFGTAVFSAADSGFHGGQIAHVINATEDLDLVTLRFRDASRAYAGETAAERMRRFCEEEGIDFEIWGDPDETEPVGPQPIGLPADILAGAAAVDGGILGEIRDKLGLRYTTRRQLGKARPLEIAYTDSILSTPPEAVEDDRYTQNDVSVSRPSGSSARHVVETGPMSVLPPPAGVGRYERSVSLAAATDTQLSGLAQWQTHIGSWDEYRVPTLAFNMARPEVADDELLTYDLMALDWGDGITVTDMPSFLPPDDLSLLVLGYTEEIGRFIWTIIHNTAPFGPYRNWYLSNANTGEPRLDATASYVNAAITTTATSLVIRTNAELCRWVNSTDHPAEFPFDIKVAGERMTVTAITVGAASGSDWHQTATVTRSVNGVVKEHTAGTQMGLWEPAWGTL
jgi:hypothetical protein